MQSLSRYRQVARIHAGSIDQGFLATLGIPFLSLMYQAIDEAASSVLITDEVDGVVRGFVAGGVGMGPIYWRMMCYPFRLALALLPSVIRPRRVKRMLEVLSYERGRAVVEDLPSAELLSIAVDPAWRGTGVAESLYARLRSHFADKGVSRFRIVVGEALEPAHRFYRRMGAHPAGSIEVHRGVGSVIYVDVSTRP